MKMRRCIPILAALAFALSFGASAQAAAPAPAWSLDAGAYPTNLVQGTTGAETLTPRYQIVATNVGGSSTSGEYTISDVLPAGVTAKAPFGFYGRGNNISEFPLACGTVGQTVTCTAAAPVAPGENVLVQIPVKVAGAAEVVVNEATASGGNASADTEITETDVGSFLPEFGFLKGTAGGRGTTVEADGTPALRAGAHPYQLRIGLGFPSFVPNDPERPLRAIGGGVKDVEVALPPGVVVNPQATSVRCREFELESAAGCPIASQVGLITPTISLGGRPASSNRALYNMVPAPGSPGEFGFEVIDGTYLHLQGALRTDGQYTLAATSSDILAKVPIEGVVTTLWGSPTDESHDASRGECLSPINGESGPFPLCPVARQQTPFLTQPSACSGPLTTTARADSWLAPGLFDERRFAGEDLHGNPVGIEGCSALSFEPSIAIEPDVRSTDTPTGLVVDLKIPQNPNYGEFATANLKSAKVTLPAGFAVNPSAANGRSACSAAQVGLESAAGALPVRFSNAPASCPDNAKVGKVGVETPLLKDEPEPGVKVPHVLPGSIYLAKPYENPFGSLLAIYIVIDDPQTGVIIKLPGKVEANQVSGQLTTTFDENPQLPFEDFRLEFFGGPRAALRTPETCGSYTTLSELSPWSGTAAVGLAGTSPITAAATGGACATSAAQQPHLPSFLAGTVTPRAGAYSPFALHLARRDGDQQIRALNTTLPPGLTGRLAGVPYCPEAAIAAAAGKSGVAEQAVPSCPSASRVGEAIVGAGAGSTPYFVTGNVYLAGPYRGAPLSLAIITPAVAGPYDLGTVVVRAALYVDPETAQITVRSDPIPQILQGIPLDVRSIAVEVDRPQFTLNPTSCEPMALGAEAISTLGQIAPLSSRFQVGGCAALPFKPKVLLRVFGKTNRNAKPRFRAVVQTKPGEANIGRAQVNLPHSDFLEQAHIKTICTRVQFNAGAGNGAACPTNSIYGHARAFTPLLDKPLEGPVFLRSSSHKLPDLVAALNGQVNVVLAGKVDSGPNKGIRNTFEVVPDAPVSRFILEMKGGKKGLLVNSENLCAKRAKTRAIITLTGQNGKVEHFKPKVKNACGKSRAKHRRSRHHRSGRH